MRCLPWPMVAGHGDERERCINGDILEEKIFWEFGGILENGNLEEKLDLACGGRKE